MASLSTRRVDNDSLLSFFCLLCALYVVAVIPVNRCVATPTQELKLEPIGEGITPDAKPRHRTPRDPLSILKGIFSNSKAMDGTILSWTIEMKNKLDEANPFGSIEEGTPSSIVGYSQDEKVIKSVFNTLLNYLFEKTDEHKRAAFFKHATSLPKHVSNLFDGLLGKSRLNGDIMTFFKDKHQCHARKIRDDIELIVNIIAGGVRIYQEYLHRRNVSLPSILDSQRVIRNRTLELSTRMEGMLFECQMDESQIEDEMKTILQTELSLHPLFSIRRNQDAARSILRFLEDKYDSKLWTVFVVTGESLSHLTFGKDYSFRISEGFRLARVNTTMAGAVSVDRIHVDHLSQTTAIYMKQFGFPMKAYEETLFLSSAYLNDAKYHLDEYLNVMRIKIVTEYLTILYSPSESDDVTKIRRVVIVESEGSPNFHIGEQDSEGILTAVVVPVRPTQLLHSWSSLSEEHRQPCEYDVNVTDIGRPLRSQANSMYITVQGNSKEDGAYIILDQEWRNETGQRWRLVDNQLRNDHGKCLSAWYRIHARLYQYDCKRNWTEQQWFRHGLQIVNGYQQCLTLHDDNSLRRNYDTYTFYPYHDYCKDNLIAMYWNDWHWNCPVDLNYRTPEGATTLANAFSKRYLTIPDIFVRNEGEHRPWMNQLGQYWFVTNGTLLSTGGECLAPYIKVTMKPPLFPHLYDYDMERRTLNVYLVRHDCQQHRWIFNQQGQLVYTKYGMCLTALGYSQEVQLVKCDGHADQRWISAN